MRDEDEPKLVTSAKSQRVVVDGYAFTIEIYRLDDDDTWSLEVTDCEGTSHVWNDAFISDDLARRVALEAIRRDGALAFMRANNVIPFPTN